MSSYFYIPLIFSPWALLFLRIVLAKILIAHGWPKIKNLKQNAENFSGMGFRPGKFWGTIAALLEFFGGLAILIGFMIQPVALFIVGEFLVILGWRLKNKHAFVGGWELDLLILAGVLALFTLGGGAYALDSFLY